MILEQLLNKEIHCIEIDFQHHSSILLNFLNKIQLHNKEDIHNIKMDDGYFYPYPYSTIHDHSSFDQFHPYFTSYLDFEKKHSAFISWLHLQLEISLSTSLHPLITDQGLKFSKFNNRFLFAQKNGIDIHCENAFINQLNPQMSSWMESVINLRNAVSFFLVLQAPDAGGELVVFNQEWDQISFPIRHETYEDRHDIDGMMFKKKGVQNIQYQKIYPVQGKGVIFRAAQIWHGINRINGNKSRITIGCFIAKGKDGKNYFWA